MMETKNITMGILAHVDAGKTTLTEAVLYKTGVLKKPGRVDHRDAFLDYDPLERQRGITVFSKQVVFPLDDWTVTLLDTPGHADFSGEMERTLSVLDYAVLVVSGADGVQGHTATLWKLLSLYELPVFIFVNKMDQPGTSREALMENLKKELSDDCIDFSVKDEDFYESVAMSDEAALNIYMETGRVDDRQLAGLIRSRRVFPCFFGSALRVTGLDEFLRDISNYMLPGKCLPDFGALAFKIMRDDRGERLTFLKVTGGRLAVRSLPDGKNKVNQIRIYSGAAYETRQEVTAGTVCAVTGLADSVIGQGYGVEKGAERARIRPVLHYRLILPEGTDVVKTLRQLRELEEEEPLLHVTIHPAGGEIQLQLMGDVQTEVIGSLIRDRFGLEVEFGHGDIVYKETVRAPVTGLGHYEPLRHYAEVHVRLDPLPPGSGVEIASECSEDDLDRNWQRLILTHFQERDHPGVLTGSPLTDVRLTLTAGKAHLKHTEGGDFRQAAYRAIRQGLKAGESVLLEPWYDFRLELPQGEVGRAMADIQRMSGTFSGPEVSTDGQTAVLKGRAPAAAMNGYQREMLSYTRGLGRLSMQVAGYAPCHNPEEVIDRIGYDSERDTDNPTSSVFCAHGAGFLVPWYEVRDYMHIKEDDRDPYDSSDREGNSDWHSDGSRTGRQDTGGPGSGSRTGRQNPGRSGQEKRVEDAALQAIYDREFGSDQKRLDRYSGYRKNRNGETDISRGGSGNRADGADRGGSGNRTDGADRGGSGNRTDGADRGGSGNRTDGTGPGVRRTSRLGRVSKKDREKKDYLLVDGYNVIYAWEELRDLAETSLDAARMKLADILTNYQGYTGCIVILVFDAYKVRGNKGEVSRYHNIYFVYTKEAETADQYIEKTTHEIGRRHNVTVATSDGVEQVIVMGQGAARMSSRDLHEEIERIETEIRKLNEEQIRDRNYLFDQLDERMAAWIEEVRLGRSVFDG